MQSQDARDTEVVGGRHGRRPRDDATGSLRGVRAETGVLRHGWHTCHLRGDWMARYSMFENPKTASDPRPNRPKA